MAMNKRYFFETSGFEFEAEMADYLTLFARREWGDSAVKFSTARQDRFEGTDIFVLGIPIDLTLNFSGKNKTKKLGALELEGVTIDLGVRFGNGKAKFETPVLVIGAETACGINKHNMWVTMEIIKSNISKVLNWGMDRYFQMVDV